MPKRKVDKNSIIRHLRKNARKSFVDMAKDEGVAVSTIFDHVNILEETSINRYTCIVNYQNIGFPFRSFLFCGADLNNDFLNHLSILPNTNNLLRTTNGGLVADLLFASLADEESFRASLQNIHSVSWSMHRVIETMGEEQWVPQLKK